MNNVYMEVRFKFEKYLYLDATRLLHVNHKLAQTSVQYYTNYVQLKYKTESLYSHFQNTYLTVQCTRKYACFRRISYFAL